MEVKGIPYSVTPAMTPVSSGSTPYEAPSKPRTEDSALRTEQHGRSDAPGLGQDQGPCGGRTPHSPKRESVDRDRSRGSALWIRSPGAALRRNLFSPVS